MGTAFSVNEGMNGQEGRRDFFIEWGDFLIGAGYELIGQSNKLMPSGNEQMVRLDELMPSANELIVRVNEQIAWGNEVFGVRSSAGGVQCVFAGQSIVLWGISGLE